MTGENEIVRSNFLDYALSNSSLKQKDIAKVIGIDANNFSKWTRGTRNLGQEKLQLMIKFNEKYQKPISILD